MTCAALGVVLLAWPHHAWLLQHWSYVLGGLLLLVAALAQFEYWTSNKRQSACAMPSVEEQGGQQAQARIKVAAQWVNEELDFYTRYGLAQNVWYRLCRVPVIVFASAIPVIVLAWPAGVGPKVAAILGALIAVLEALSSSFRFRDNWLTSIAARDRLLLEGRLFAAVAGPYTGKKDEERCALFVERAVGHVQSESEEWRKNQLLEALQHARDKQSSDGKRGE